MRTYTAFYRGKSCQVEAQTSYEAQQRAAVQFRAKKSYDVTVVLCDTPVNTATL